MPTLIHFIDVGQGNMVLIEASNGANFLFDCNITDDNESRVLGYVARQIDEGSSLKAFICSHRDADHMRGVKKLHARFPIQEVWDSDHVGTTTTSAEYKNYMDLRRKVRAKIIEKRKYFDFGHTRLRMLSAKDSRLEKNANAQGIVIKAEQRDAGMTSIKGSAMLPADSDAETWRYGILKDYNKADVSSDIMMAGHHGSNSFFDDPNDRYYYTEHLQAISPAMTVVSVGPNSHGHPKADALKFYDKYSTGSKQGNKVFRTEKRDNEANLARRWRLESINSIMIGDWFDRYSLQARLAPALLTLFPPILLVAILFPALYQTAIGIIGVLTVCGVLTLVSHFARSAGKKVEERLIRRWGGRPTTILLENTNGELDEKTHARYLAFFRKKIPDWELGTDTRADFESAVRWLLERTRDTQTYALIFKENISYGFRRNCLGLKPFRLSVALLCAAFWIAVLRSEFTALGDLEPSNIFGLAISAPLVLW